MKQNWHLSRIRRPAQKAFTLIEMLIVAALISIFAGLAIFNITTQLELNKQKAAVAECRQIATAMSFVYQDLGIFPKICWLRFNLPSLLAEMNSLGLTPDTAGFNAALDYHSNNVPNLYSKLEAKWRGGYIALNPERSVKMQFPGYGGTGTEDWQADPWGNPYVAYFVHTVPAATAGAQPTLRFLASAQEKADYFAGIVSYGRNHVPGLGDFPAQALIDDRRTNRSLYKGAGPTVYQSLIPSEYNQNRLDMILLVTPNPFPATEPRIRDAGSDDRVVEF